MGGFYESALTVLQVRILTSLRAIKSEHQNDVPFMCPELRPEVGVSGRLLIQQICLVTEVVASEME